MLLPTYKYIEGKKFILVENVTYKAFISGISASEALIRHTQEYFKSNKFVLKTTSGPYIIKNGYFTILAYEKKLHPVDGKHFHWLWIWVVINEKIYVHCKEIYFLV
jgi:hypothetical protein